MYFQYTESKDYEFHKQFTMLPQKLDFSRDFCDGCIIHMFLDTVEDNLGYKLRELTSNNIYMLQCVRSIDE